MGRRGRRSDQRATEAMMKLEVAGRLVAGSARWAAFTAHPGHEDLDLHGRSQTSGGWDPGALRDEPWWHWAFAVQVIEAVVAMRSLPAKARDQAGALLLG